MGQDPDRGGKEPSVLPSEGGIAFARVRGGLHTCLHLLVSQVGPCAPLPTSLHCVGNLPAPQFTGTIVPGQVPRGVEDGQLRGRRLIQRESPKF